MTSKRHLLNILVVVVVCTPTWWIGAGTAFAFEKESSHNSSLTDLGSASNHNRSDDFVCPCPWRKKTPSCDAVLDLGFVVEASASIEKYGPGNFKRLLQFVSGVIQKFSVSPTKTRVGVVTFGAKTNLLFGFQRYSSVLPALVALHHAQSYSHTSSRMGNALLFAERHLFPPSRHRRPRVLVAITDGKSTDDVFVPSKRLKSRHVIIYGVGVGRYFSIEQLEQMASRPRDGNVFIGQFNKLHHVRDGLVRSMCLGVGGALQMPGEKPCLCKTGKLKPGCKPASSVQVQDCDS